MKRVVKEAFLSTIPVMTGYLALGFGFGIILRSAGYGVLLAFAMSLLIYAGSMQYVAVGLLTGGASLLSVALTTLMVNARHLFYGVSMLSAYEKMGSAKPYLIFSLTDETYSLLCTEHPRISERERKTYCLLVSLLDHTYWVTGTVTGAVAGGLLTFNTEGMDFVLTALFLTVFLEQWLSTEKHVPALIGIGASLLCLLIFGAEGFLIPALALIALLLCLYREEARHES